MAPRRPLAGRVERARLAVSLAPRAAAPPHPTLSAPRGGEGSRDGRASGTNECSLSIPRRPLAGGGAEGGGSARLAVSLAPRAAAPPHPTLSAPRGGEGSRDGWASGNERMLAFNSPPPARGGRAGGGGSARLAAQLASCAAAPPHPTLSAPRGREALAMDGHRGTNECSPSIPLRPLAGGGAGGGGCARLAAQLASCAAAPPHPTLSAPRGREALAMDGHRGTNECSPSIPLRPLAGGGAGGGGCRRQALPIARAPMPSLDPARPISRS